MKKSSLTDSKLLIVTVCKNNPDDLRMTCQSVAKQSHSPTRHIVVDSSEANIRGRMEEISAVSAAQFVWLEPKGIYQAMLGGLSFADSTDWVWFLNATDWLSSSESVSKVVEALSLEAEGPGQKWWVGKTVVGGDTPHLMKFSSSGEDFVRQLRRGSIGLPHSSTIVQADALQAVKAFEGDYRISRDYEMALRLADVFGPPGLIPSPLSVYDESGESARNAWSNVLHKSEARIKNQPWWQLPAEPFRILGAGRRELLRRRLRKNPGNERSWRALGWERIDPEMAQPFWEREDP